MKLSGVLLHLVCVYVCFTCSDRDHVSPRDYPRVRTLPVDNITAEGARFKGEITFINQETEQFGFLWSQNQTQSLVTSEILNFGTTSSPGVFSADIERSLASDKEYYVCAYIKTPEKTVFGNVVSFTSLGSKAPQIESFSPVSGFIRDTVQIKGRNFSNLRINTRVTFDVASALLVAVSDTLLTVLVPETLVVETSSVSVTVLGNVTSATEKFSLIGPELQSVFPNAVTVGDTLTIKGNNFSKDRSNLYVYLSSISCPIISHSENELKVIVPFFRTTSDEQVLSVKSSNVSAIYPESITYLEPLITDVIIDGEVWLLDTIRLSGQYLFPGITCKFAGKEITALQQDEDFIDLVIPPDLNNYSNVLQVSFGQNVIDFEATITLATPVIESVIPSEATFNEEVVLKGRNFHPTMKENHVNIAGYNAEVIAVTDESITAKVPVTIENCISSNSCNSLELVVLGRNASGNSDFKLKTPVIESVDPGEITNGQLLTIRGKYFHPNNTSFNRSIINESILFPISATSTTLVYNTDVLNTDPAISARTETSVRVANSNSFPLILNFVGPYTLKSSFPGNLERLNVSIAVAGSRAYVGLGNERITTNLLSDFYEYNAEEDTWTKLPDFPGIPRRYPVTFALNDYVYVGMGLGINADSKSYILTDMWRYSVTSGSWEQIADFPGTPKHSAYAFVVNGTAYVGGGSLIPFGEVTEIWTFDGVAWQQKNNAPDTSSGQVEYFIESDETLYVFFRTKLYRYSVSGDSWSHVSNYPSPTQIYSFTGGMIDGVGYLWARVSGAVLYRYFPLSNSWTQSAIPINTPLYPRSFIINKKLYTLFGLKSSMAGTSTSPDMWEFDYTKLP